MAVKKLTKKETATKKTPTTSKKESAKSTAPTKKNPALAKLVNDINTKFGENALSLGVLKNEDGSVRVIQRLSTGCIALDVALGGGLPIGRYIEISGMLSSTKTTLCIHILKEAQKMGFTVAWFDVEGTTDEAYFKACGVEDAESILYSRPDGMEEALQMADVMARSGMVQLIVIDSIAMLSPTKERESDMDESVQMGLAPKLLGEYFRKLNSANNRLAREGKQEVTVIGINQLREKIGAYGDPEYSPGGRAKGYAQSIDIRLRRGDWITTGTGKDKQIIGQAVKFKIEKNKTFKRMQVGEMDFYFDENPQKVPVNYYDNMKSIVLLGVQWGLIKQGGAWFTYENERYQGVAKLVDDLRAKPELYNKLHDEIIKLTSEKLVVS